MYIYMFACECMHYNMYIDVVRELILYIYIYTYIYIHTCL